MSIICLLLFFQIQIHAFSWQHVFNALTTGMHWSIVGSTALAAAGNQVAGSNSLKQYPLASVETQRWAKDQLETYNCPQDIIDNVDIKAGKKFQAGYILNGKHIITIPHDMQDINSLTQEQKILIAVTLRHEAAHLEHKDMWRGVGVCLLSPIVSHFLIKGAAYPIRSLVSSNLPIVAQSLLKIPLAFAQLAVMGLIYVAFSKYKEYQADYKAAQSIKDHAALSNFSTLCSNLYADYEKKNQLNPEDRNTWTRFLYDEIHTPDHFHPSYQIRARVFEKAAQQIT